MSSREGYLPVERALRFLHDGDHLYGPPEEPATLYIQPHQALELRGGTKYHPVLQLLIDVALFHLVEKKVAHLSQQELQVACYLHIRTDPTSQFQDLLDLTDARGIAIAQQLHELRDQTAIAEVLPLDDLFESLGEAHQARIALNQAGHAVCEATGNLTRHHARFEVVHLERFFVQVVCQCADAIICCLRVCK